MKYSDLKVEITHHDSTLDTAWLYMEHCQQPGFYVKSTSDTTCKIVALGFVDSLQTGTAWLSYDSLTIRCLQQLAAEAEYYAREEWGRKVDSLKSEAVAGLKHCFDQPYRESFYVSYEVKEYQYTLYYYDQSGNLVQTVPPAGVDVLPTTAFNAKGKWKGSDEPDHRLPTQYKHTSFEALRWQNTPDGDSTRFWYDSKGKNQTGPG